MAVRELGEAREKGRTYARSALTQVRRGATRSNASLVGLVRRGVGGGGLAITITVHPNVHEVEDQITEVLALTPQAQPSAHSTALTPQPSPHRIPLPSLHWRTGTQCHCPHSTALTPQPAAPHAQPSPISHPVVTRTSLPMDGTEQPPCPHAHTPSRVSLDHSRVTSVASPPTMIL